jgi:hypothetical protein
MALQCVVVQRVDERLGSMRDSALDSAHGPSRHDPFIPKKALPGAQGTNRQLDAKDSQTCWALSMFVLYPNSCASVR